MPKKQLIDVTSYQDTSRQYIETYLDSSPYIEDSSSFEFSHQSGENIDIASIAEMVKRSLGYLEKPLIKCAHCGQYGAAYCACPKCGAPIDPE